MVPAENVAQERPYRFGLGRVEQCVDAFDHGCDPSPAEHRKLVWPRASQRCNDVMAVATKLRRFTWGRGLPRCSASVPGGAARATSHRRRMTRPPGSPGRYQIDRKSTRLN